MMNCISAGSLLKILALREKYPTAELKTPYMPVFSSNTEKYRPEKTPYLDPFHAVDRECL